MKQKVSKTEFENLVETLQEHYKLNEETGDYELQFEDTGLNSALEQERKTAKNFKKRVLELEAKIKELDELGKSPEELKELLQKHKELEESELQKKGEYETLKNQLIQEHKKNLQKKDEEISGLKKTIRKEKVNTKAATICAQIGVPVEPILDRLERVAQMDEKSLDIIIKDGENILFSQRDETKGQNMDIEEYVQDFLPQNESYATFYPPDKTKTGSGAKPGSGQRQVPGSASKISQTELETGAASFNLEDILEGKVEVVND